MPDRSNLSLQSTETEGIRPGSATSKSGAASILRPTHVFDNRIVRATDRRDYLLGYIEKDFPGQISITDRDGSFCVEDWALPGIMFSSNRVGRNVTNWNLSRKRRWDVDLIMVRLILEGEMRGVYDGVPAKMSRGDTYIKDLTTEASVQVECSRFSTLYIPYEAVGYRPERGYRFRHFHGTSPEGRLLGSLIRGFAEALPQTDEADAPRLTRTVVDMLGAMIDPNRADLASDHLARARIEAITAHIRRTITANDLDIDQLCTRFGVSRATLYRDFSRFGGVERFAANCRLDQVYRALEESAPDRGAVRRVSEHWGFHNPAHFTRAFRQRFGMAPSDVVSTALADQQWRPANVNTTSQRVWATRFQSLQSA